MTGFRIKSDEKAFCYQCQETAKNTGCTVKGVCGKTEEVAKLQDLLIYTVKGISEIIVKTNKNPADIKEMNHEVITSLADAIEKKIIKNTGIKRSACQEWQVQWNPFGCAKYRYNKLELGNIGGIPRSFRLLIISPGMNRRQ